MKTTGKLVEEMPRGPREGRYDDLLSEVRELLKGKGGKFYKVDGDGRKIYSVVNRTHYRRKFPDLLIHRRGFAVYFSLKNPG